MIRRLLDNLKRFVIDYLEYICGRLDALPKWTWRIPVWNRRSCTLARWAFDLEERWFPEEVAARRARLFNEPDNTPADEV